MLEAPVSSHVSNPPKAIGSRGCAPGKGGDGIVVNEGPLDPTTARVVAELAAALLPQLKETIALEVTKAAEIVPSRTAQGVDEALASLRRLQDTSGAATEVMSAMKDSMNVISGNVLPSLSKACESLDASVSRLAQEAAGPATRETERLMRSVESAIFDWEGVLKADGRAQTRELNEFSSEISELLRDLKASLPPTIQESVEKALVLRDEDWAYAVEKRAEVVEQKLAGLSKALWGAAFVIFLAVVIAFFFR
jgi:hypothetical protein